MCCTSCTLVSLIEIAFIALIVFKQAESTEKGINDEEILSWRRLHMSRAKLIGVENTSALVSLFAFITLVEIQLTYPTEVPEWLWVIYAVSTTFLVSVHVIALTIATYILPAMEPMAKLSTLAGAPHEQMKFYVELAWILSNTIGLFLVIIQIIILCWVKFYDYSQVAATSATGLGLPSTLLLFGFAFYFYQAYVVTKWQSSSFEINELELRRNRLDEIT